jgi:transposase
MMGHRSKQFKIFAPTTLESLVPPDSFYRMLDRKLDLSFVRVLVRDRYEDAGRPSIDPIVFFKLQLVLFFEGLRSERELVRTAADRLSVRWYLGYDFDEPLPDHSSLTRIRQRLGLPTFDRFFERVVELCQEAGLVWGKELFIDATKVRANADVDSLVPRFYQQAKQHLQDLFADEGAAAQADAGVVGADESPNESMPVGDLRPQRTEEEPSLAQENLATWKLLEEHRLDPARPASAGYRRTSDFMVSTTDPDAVPMRARNGAEVRLGYHDHYVVDGGKARIILNALVTPADVMENQAMVDLIHRVRFRWQLRPKRVVGDTAYGTAETIRAMEEQAIRAYVPLPDWEPRTPYYGSARFAYDTERDEYRCPQGQSLQRRRAKYTERVVVYQADAAICNACPVKAACTASNHGRQVRRPFEAEYLDRVRVYHQTALYGKMMRKRQVWVEPLFGEAKDWHGLRRFRLRTLWKVNVEALLTATGQNLKRLLKRRGWGRRAWPGGAPSAAWPTDRGKILLALSPEPGW